MWVDQRGSEIIPLPECLRLLALAAKQGDVGRLAVSRQEAPVVHPVNFAYRDRRVLVRLGPGAMAEAATGALVAFEIDHLDHRVGVAWSVLVRGLALVVEDDVPSEAPTPLVPTAGDVVLGIRLDVVTGRRFVLHALPIEAAGPGGCRPHPGRADGRGDEAQVDGSGDGAQCGGGPEGDAGWVPPTGVRHGGSTASGGAGATAVR